jgi:membrane protein implicated in regulation of membrane protease activity
MRNVLRDNGLTLVLMVMFLASVAGMVASGLHLHNQELLDHGQAQLDLVAYVTSGKFLSALFENWESEFLQMSAYVVLTAILFQRGSAESRDPDNPHRAGDELEGQSLKKYPVWAWLYSYSLGIALCALFIASFLMHWWSSLRAANADAMMHGLPPASLAQHLASKELWFESFQNWQSEFLSTAVLVVLSIFLRHKGSPESKPVADAHGKTGSE